MKGREVRIKSFLLVRKGCSPRDLSTYWDVAWPHEKEIGTERNFVQAYAWYMKANKILEGKSAKVLLRLGQRPGGNRKE